MEYTKDGITYHFETIWNEKSPYKMAKLVEISGQIGKTLAIPEIVQNNGEMYQIVKIDPNLKWRSQQTLVTDKRRKDYGKFIVSGGNFYYTNIFGDAQDSIKEIILPKTIKIIGTTAFADCRNLQKVVLNDGLEIIGDGAFGGCSSLKTITIPKTVSFIGKQCFAQTPKMVIKIQGQANMVDFGDNAIESDDEVVYVDGSSSDSFFTKLLNVFKKENETDLKIENQLQSDHECVDLGLSSGVKWAICNIGANKPEEYGDYIAWGETKAKSEYPKYKTKMFPISNTSRDAATVQWGDLWRMPTKRDFKELLEMCKWEWVKINGTNGYKVIGPNGNSIFLPAAGMWYIKEGKEDATLVDVEEEGNYCSSTPSTSSLYAEDCAYCLSFDDKRINIWDGRFYTGRSIRPVTDFEIVYNGQRAEKHSQEETKPLVKPEKKETPQPEQSATAVPPVTIDLDKLIEAVIADGVITDKERSVIIKKATAAGYDADEVEILLDGKLAEKLLQSIPNSPVVEETKPEAKPEEKTSVIQEEKPATDTVKSEVAKKETSTKSKSKQSSVSYEDYVVTINEDKSISVTLKGDLCDNTKKALREIAELVGFEVDDKWTTRQFGSKLVAFLSEKK